MCGFASKAANSSSINSIRNTLIPRSAVQLFRFAPEEEGISTYMHELQSLTYVV